MATATGAIQAFGKAMRKVKSTRASRDDQLAVSPIGNSTIPIAIARGTKK
jgi:hypothetical protein